MELFDTFLFSLISKHEEPLNLLKLFICLVSILLYTIISCVFKILVYHSVARGGVFLLKFANLPDVTLPIISQDIKQQPAVMPKSHTGEPGQLREASDGEWALATVPMREWASGS